MHEIRYRSGCLRRELRSGSPQLMVIGTLLVLVGGAAVAFRDLLSSASSRMAAPTSAVIVGVPLLVAGVLVLMVMTVRLLQAARRVPVLRVVAGAVDVSVAGATSPWPWSSISAARGDEVPLWVERRGENSPMRVIHIGPVVRRRGELRVVVPSEEVHPLVHDLRVALDTAGITLTYEAATSQP
ncbi:hypothetical protein [Demequina phytophila]|uniref:hypothetical protein n=1 Tax=Demequina phytophila TaxID=1638981 RepID=UPI0007856369|nr:hypothetical protein [Demequina phytophila]